MLACCLENSSYEQAENAYAGLVSQYFDWNEIRVSTLRELAESLSGLNDPEDAAARLRGALQSIFESRYSFDLESFKKQNIGQAVKSLEKYNGVTPFVVAYTTQMGLGGHAIPLNKGSLKALFVIGAMSEAEAEKGVVPGLERAVSKSKGVEYASLLHQLGVQLITSPYAPASRQILLEIAPDCKTRLPKRPSKRATPDAASAKRESPAKDGKTPSRKATAKSKAGSAKKSGDKKKATGKQGGKPAKTAKTTPKKKKTTKKKTKASTSRLSKRKPR